MDWYKKAAEEGHADAQFRPGEYYRNGSLFGQDWKESAKWYRKAVAQKYEKAYFGLAELLYIDHITFTSKEKIMKFLQTEEGKEMLSCYETAAQLGNSEARSKLDELRKKYL